MVFVLIVGVLIISDNLFSRLPPAHAQAADITTGLVAYWKFDEGSGTTAADSSGNNNTGTLTNGPTWTAGKVNSAVSLNGTNQYVALGSDLMASGDRTACAWAYLAAPMANISWQSIFNSVYFTVQYFFANGTYSLEVTSDNNHLVSYSLPSSPVGVWNHIYVVRPGGPGLNATLYVNGVNVAADSDGDPNTAFNLDIGGNTNNPIYFNGKIDEVRVYNRLLTDQEIKRLYNMGHTGS